MDLLVRFCDSKVSEVTERCLHLEFLGRATEEDTLVHVKNVIAEIAVSCLIQVAMDGSNVN